MSLEVPDNNISRDEGAIHIEDPAGRANICTPILCRLISAARVYTIGGENMTKYQLYKFTATADHEPDNYYQYAGQYGTKAWIWTYHDMKDAVVALADHESRCVPTQDGLYQVICYAVEPEEV